MTDNKERLAIEGPKTLALRSMVINGAIVVESQEEREKKRAERAKKRKSRWDNQGQGSSSSSAPTSDSTAVVPHGSNISKMKNKYNVVPQLPSMINIENTTDNAQEIYLCNMGIRDCTNRLGHPNLMIPPNPRDRSPSPEPIYNAKGVRMNTRYERTRQKLISQRNNYISKLKKLDPTYQPPTYYKDMSLEDRIEVPADEHPQHNFPGLILGPRGNHLKDLEKRTETRIMIKGKGSIKDGMTGLRKDGTKWDALDEPMHVTITGKTGKGVKEAGDYLRKLIKMQIEEPNSERMVAFRAASMHELAVLNGTLKDFQLKCLNCGGEGHKTWECPDAPNFTATTICTACGGVGHVTSDCKARRPGEVFNRSAGGAELDDEYSSFLKDMEGDCKRSKLDNPEDKPYVPPMGDLSSRAAKALGRPAPRLMLTNGSAAPGASIKAAKLASSTGCNPNMNEHYNQLKSIFGGRLAPQTSGFRSSIDLHQDKPERPKPEDRSVPTHWIAERHDKAAAQKQDQELLRLEYAKQLAKIQKKKEESRVIKVDGPPPPPPGANLPNLPKL